MMFFFLTNSGKVAVERGWRLSGSGVFHSESHMITLIDTSPTTATPMSNLMFLGRTANNDSVTIPNI